MSVGCKYSCVALSEKEVRIDFFAFSYSEIDMNAASPNWTLEISLP